MQHHERTMQWRDWRTAIAQRIILDGVSRESSEDANTLFNCPVRHARMDCCPKKTSVASIVRPLYIPGTHVK